jgi:peptide chain release factor subunit 1
MRGAGTELISVYIPSGYAISEIANKLRLEYGQAGNIKSKATRNNVQGALDKILHYLKIFRETPKNGLAIFCGNISDDPSKVDIELFSISPPQPLMVQIYRCDSTFLLEPLEALRGRKEKYGLVAIDGDEATIAILEGNVTRIVRRLNYLGPSKTQKGGSSALRYDRTVEAAKESYYSRVGDAMDETLFASGISRVIVGGPGPIKEIFIKKKPYNYQFKILGVSDIGYVDDYGISQLAAKSVDIINEEKTVRQRQMLEKFLKEIVKDGLATYGVREVLEALKLGKVEVLLLSEDFALKRATGKCPQGHEQEVFFEGGKEYKCKVCGEKLTVSEGADLFDELCDLAEEKGIKLEIISADTSDGAQFLAGFKGIGALVRYR